MTYLVAAWQWITDPARWVGADGIAARLGEHLWYTAVAVVIAAVIGIPLGLLVGHTGRGRWVAVASTSAARAIPTLGLITLLALLWGVGLTAPMVAFVILAIPSILASTYAGVAAVEPEVTDAARAMGMTGTHVLTRVELPLALPMMWGGIRSSALQVVATATLAAYVGSGGAWAVPVPGAPHPGLPADAGRRHPRVWLGARVGDSAGRRTARPGAPRGARTGPAMTG